MTHKKMTDLFSSPYLYAGIIAIVAFPAAYFINRIGVANFLSSPYLYAGIVILAALVTAYGSHRIGITRKALVETASTTLTELKGVSGTLTETLRKTEQANSKLEENKKPITKF